MLWLAFLVLAGSANAETLVATRTIRPHTILTQDDVRRAPQQDIDALQHESQAIGLEARVTLYAGRPIYAANLSTPALVERNQLVRMIYRKGGLMIVAGGRAMTRGAFGDSITALNLSSKTIVADRIDSTGAQVVGGSK